MSRGGGAEGEAASPLSREPALRAQPQDPGIRARAEGRCLAD